MSISMQFAPVPSKYSSGGYYVASSIVTIVIAIVVVVMIWRWSVGDPARLFDEERSLSRWRKKPVVPSHPARRVVEETGGFVISPLIFMMIGGISRPWQGWIFIPLVVAVLIAGWIRSGRALDLLGSSAA